MKIIERFKKRFVEKETVKKDEIIKYIPEYDYELSLIRLAENDDINMIPALFWIIFLKDNEIKKRFIKVMVKIFKEFSSRQYIALANLFREKRYMFSVYNIRWNDMGIDLLLEDYMSDDEKLTVIGLASFHPDGYFREKALRALIEINNDKSMPFIAVRAHDWIYSVRCEAENALEEIISINNIKDVINNIELIDKIKGNIESLKVYYRYDEIKMSKIADSEEKFKRIYLKIEQIFDKNRAEVFGYLRETALGKDKYTSEYAALKIMEKGYASTEDMIKVIAKMKNNNVIKAKLLRVLFTKCSKEEIIKNRTILESIEGSRTEVLIMDKFYEYGEYKNPSELEEALLSKYASVRESARFYMKKLGSNDFYEFYEKKFKEGRYNKNVLLGLCETCSAENMKALSALFDIAPSKVKKKILKRIIDLSSAGIYEDSQIFIKGISGKNLSIIKLCREYISENYDMFGHEEIYKIYEEGEERISREAAVHILCLGNSWTALRYVLTFIGVKEFHDIAYENLERWLENKLGYLVKVDESRYSHYLLHRMNGETAVEIKKAFNDNMSLMNDEEKKIISGLILNYSV